MVFEKLSFEGWEKEQKMTTEICQALVSGISFFRLHGLLPYPFTADQSISEVLNGIVLYIGFGDLVFFKNDVNNPQTRLVYVM